LSDNLEYYAYLSEKTIKRLFEEIPNKALPAIALELGMDLKFLTAKLTLSPNDNQRTLTARLKAVLKYLEKHEPQNIGTIDNPAKYIKGTEFMFSYFMPQGFGVGWEEPPELIYFGASTKETILGLAGSASYVFTQTDGVMSPLSSALPYLAYVIARKSGVKLSHPAFNNPDNNDVITALSAMEYMEEYNRKEDHMQTYSFFAN
jgi:hypothetical protein